MDTLWRLDAAQLVQGYRSGAFTPLQALDACLARSAAWQPHLNAMVLVDADSARAAAGASGARWAAGTPLGPLDGVPVSLKDNLHAQGWPTSWGSRLLQGFIAQRDELPVARLRAGGAVLFGKTNLPEFAMQGSTANRVFGTTRNPWNTALTPGGSSGGAVAAVAAGCGPLALGTDGGGSTRRPASHTGLVGFKPSAGLVPRGDGLPEIFLDHEVAGAIGRTVRDVQAMAMVLASPHGLPQATVRPSRILFVPRFGGQPVDAAIAAQVRAAAGRFEALGHQVEEAASFDLADAVNALWPTLSNTGLAWLLERADAHPEFGLPPGGAIDTSQCTEAAQANLRDGAAAPASRLFELLQAVHTLKLALAVLFGRHDFILTPATAAAASTSALRSPLGVGTTMMISPTPATWAGIAFISTLDG